MNVLLSKPIGYCYGVTNAINIAKNIINKHQDKNVYIFGLLIHNKEIIPYLESFGIKTIDTSNIDVEDRLNKFTSDDVVIFMLGNTVNKYCPYFDEMGLRHIKDMKQGEIDVYQLKHTSGKVLKVAVEYCKPFEKGKKSDFYFAFDNQKLEMITNGIWEIDIYPHCPYRYKPKNILFTYFIEFDRELLQCEIVQIDNICFTFIHRKTTPLKHPETDLVFTTRFDARPNYRRKLTRPNLPIEKMIVEFFATDKIFYQDNEVGELVRNYLIWCNK